MEEPSYESTPRIEPRPSQAESQRERRGLQGSDWRGDLRRTILTRVIPRMAETRAALLLPAASPLPVVVSTGQVIRFAGLVLSDAVPTLVAHIQALRSSGLGMEAVLLQLVTPAARHLGDLWAQDRVSFIDVTAGISRLQGVIRAMGPGFDAGGPQLVPGKRILLAPAFGEQHVLGLTMVAAFFRRAGWDVVFEPRMVIDEMLAMVRIERFAAIGLSVATDKGLDAVRSQVDAIRNASLTDDIMLLAGGPAFLDSSVDAAGLGVDGVTSDAAGAVRLAEAVLAGLDTRLDTPPFSAHRHLNSPQAL